MIELLLELREARRLELSYVVAQTSATKSSPTGERLRRSRTLMRTDVTLVEGIGNCICWDEHEFS